MWTQILVYVLLTLFVLCYAATGWCFVDIFGDNKSRFKKYLIGLFWPVVLLFTILIFVFLLIVAFVLTIGFLFAVLFQIIKSLIKREKIDWDTPIF